MVGFSRPLGVPCAHIHTFDLLGECTSIFKLTQMVVEQPLSLEVGRIADELGRHVQNNNVAALKVLHYFQLCNSIWFIGPDLGFWVKPRSNIWFSCLVLEEHEDDRWTTLFRMTKASVFRLSNLLRPHIQWQNTRYQYVTLVLIRVVCTLLNWAQGLSINCVRNGLWLGPPQFLLSYTSLDVQCRSYLYMKLVDLLALGCSKHNIVSNTCGLP